MVNKIINVIINTIFPLTYLERFLLKCSHTEFLLRLTPRPQYKTHEFYPYYYKDPLVKDCIIELKERNNQNVARLFSHTLSMYILKCIHNIENENGSSMFYIIPAPQHISKTKEKGFLHTQTLCNEILRSLKKRKQLNITIFPCIEKHIKTKRLHDLKSKTNRFKAIKNTMKAYITKHDAQQSYFFLVDDVFTTGATFKEMRRTLLESGAFLERLFFISIAH